MQSADVAAVIFWLVILLAILVIFTIAAFVARRILLKRDSTEQSPGFDMTDLSRLHECGKLTDEEYRALRRSAARSWNTRKDA